MEIFFIIIFLLVIVWAWNADNSITLETEEDLSTENPIKNQKNKSKTNTKNNDLIESFTGTDNSSITFIEKINEYSSLTNRNGDNLMLAHVYFLYCLIYISLIIGIYLTN